MKNLREPISLKSLKIKVYARTPPGGYPPDTQLEFTSSPTCTKSASHLHQANFRRTEKTKMLILLIVLILVFGFGGYRMGPGLGYYGGGGLSLVLTIVLILLLLKVI
jgi:hypothetical protein